MKKKDVQRIELVFFMLYPILATIIALSYKVNFLTGILLFLALPSIYLSFRVPFPTMIRSFLFSLILVPVSWVINYLAHIHNQWIIPNTVVPFYIARIPMFEISLWIVFLFHFTVLFYEYFLDRHFVKKAWYPKMKTYLKILVFLPVFTLLLDLFIPLSYFYMYLGIIGIVVPILMVEFNQPKLIAKFMKVAMYFFYVTFSYEIVALKLHQWYFPLEGRFFGWVIVFGERFPIEEFVFWLVLCAMATLSYYEYFDDDYK